MTDETMGEFNGLHNARGNRDWTGCVEKDDQGRFVLPLNAAVRFNKITQLRYAREYSGG